MTLRTFLVMLGCLVTAVALMAVAPPVKKPTVSTSVRRDYAAGVVWLKWGVSGPGDSLTVDATASGHALVHRKYTVDSKVDSVSYPAPAPSGVLSGTFKATNWRRLLSSPVTQAWSYTEPDVPPRRRPSTACG